MVIFNDIQVLRCLNPNVNTTKLRKHALSIFKAHRKYFFFKIKVFHCRDSLVYLHNECIDSLVVSTKVWTVILQR